MDVEFVSWDEVIELHRHQLAMYGGQEGFIDESVVHSALNRPKFTL